MACGTRLQLKESAKKVQKVYIRKKNLDKSEKALLFSSFVAVTGRVPTVKKHKVVGEVIKHCEKHHNWAPSENTVRKWVKIWGENNAKFEDGASRPKTYNSKRKRVLGQIESHFKQKKSCEDVAFEEFDDSGEKVRVFESQ